MADRKVFQDSVTPLPEQSGLTHNGLMIKSAEPEHRDEQMTILFSLELPPEAQADLEDRVARGEVVPLAELNKKYSPAPADRKALVAWLKKQGFKITEVSDDGTSVYARGTVGQIEKTRIRGSVPQLAATVWLWAQTGVLRKKAPPGKARPKKLLPKQAALPARLPTSRMLPHTS